MAEQIIPVESEYERLLREIRELQTRVAALIALRDDLLYHICPALRAKYEEKIGALEREIYAAQLYLREKQRILEILQAQMNRQQEPSVEEAERQAGEEFREFEDELHRRAKEAEDFRNYWENRNGWDEYEEDPFEEYEGDGGDGSGESSGEGSGGDGGESSGEDSEGDGGNRSGKGGSAGNRPDSEEEGKPKDRKRSIKSLYRKIVKRLHPDIAGEMSEKDKDLFTRAREAYQAGDLETLERIWDELTAGESPEDEYRDTPEDLARMRLRIRELRAHIARLTDEITGIRVEFPHTMKAFLDDDAAVERKRAELEEQLREIREADRKLAEMIEKLREKMGTSS